VYDGVCWGELGLYLRWEERGYGGGGERGWGHCIGVLAFVFREGMGKEIPVEFDVLGINTMSTG
jgi:hypothetical protein